MSSYLEEVEGKDFIDLVENEDFQRDLVRFFSGSRYGYTREEIEELGPQGLTEEFIQHMRWQSTNEMTALNDYRYVNDEEQVSERELMSFGNLITAFDRSEGGGDGFVAGAGDYLSAFATSPSTLATIATAGWGIGSKLSARAASVATQAAIRQRVAGLVARGASVDAIQREVAGSVVGGAVRGGVASAAVEGAIGTGQSYLTGETREIATEGTETPYQYTTSDMLRDGAISALAGGAIGSVARGLDVRSQRNAIDTYASRESEAIQRRATAREAATARLNEADETVRAAAEDRAIGAAQALVNTYNSKALNPLDTELVERGDLLRQQMRSGMGADVNLTPSLSIDTVRNVAAATIDIVETLDIGPNERITSAVARALRLPEDDPASLTIDALEQIRDRYGLSREEMSYVYLSDLSEAGKTLAEASRISRARTRQQAEDAAQRELAAIAGDMGVLAQTRASTLGEAEANTILRNAFKFEAGKDPLSSALDIARQADSLRIAFMTSQVGTTFANTATSTFNLAVDASNEFFKGLYRGVVQGEVSELNPRNMFANMTSTIRGATLDRTDARIVRGLVEEEFPEQYRNLFFESTRAETAVNGNTRTARVGRFVNTLNTLTDSVFKEMTLYSGLDRRIRRSGSIEANSLGEFIQGGGRFSDLPQEVVDGAFDDARRFTFQRTYYGDESAFGEFAQFVERTHQRLPFLVSGVLGIPFPRYIANHMEHIIDYTPLGLAAGGLDRFGTMLYPGQRMAGDAFKEGSDRFARAATGASMVMGGVYFAAQKEGQIDFDSMLTETQELDLSRTAGPYLLHLYIGDAIYRWWNDLPVNNTGETLLDITLGVTDFTPDAGLIGALRESATTGEFTPDASRMLSDIAATFTYPLTIFRDVQAQINPEASAVPYTRDVLGGSTEEPSLYGEANFLDSIMLRAGREGLTRGTRFLMDTDFMQLTQSFNGKNDIPLYDPIGGYVAGTFNPLTTQLGFRTAPRPNELQREMSRLGLRDYTYYNSRTVPNAAVDYATRARLADNLNQQFIAWRDQQTLTGGGTYADRDIERQGVLLHQFLRDTIRATAERVEADWLQFSQDRPRAAQGFIRNLYIVKGQELARTTGIDDIYDRAVEVSIEGFDNARDFIADADTIEEEISRRQIIMSRASVFIDDFVGFPTEPINTAISSSYLD